MRRAIFALLFSVVTCAHGARAFAQAADASPPPTFSQDVGPLLKKHCDGCHNAEETRGDLDLTSFAALMSGGASGAVVVAGKPEESLLFLLAAHREAPKMPPGNRPRIPARDLQILERWIRGGLMDRDPSAVGATATPKSGVAESDSLAGGLVTPNAIPRPAPITAVAVSPNAPLAAIAGFRQVLVFDLAARKLLGALPFPEGELHVLRFSRNGDLLLAAGGVGGRSGRAVVFEVEGWKRRCSVGEEPDVVLAADLSPDGTAVALGGPKRVVKIVSLPDGKTLHEIRDATDWVLSLRFSPDGLLLAYGDRFGGLSVVEAESGKQFLELRGHAKALTGLGWRHDSNVLASAGEDGAVRLWDMHSGQELRNWTAHEEGALDLDYHVAGLLATCGRGGHVRVWNESAAKVAEFGPAKDSVLRVGMPADGKGVLFADWTGSAAYGSLESGASDAIPLPRMIESTSAQLVEVPLPTLPPPTATRSASPASAAPAASRLESKLAALKAVEAAVEMVKEEAAREPENASLRQAYLQLCEVSLAIKADVLRGAAREP